MKKSGPDGGLQRPLGGRGLFRGKKAQRPLGGRGLFRGKKASGQWGQPESVQEAVNLADQARQRV